MTAIRAFHAVALREVVRVARQPSRIVAAIGTPALIGAFFAGGFAASLRSTSDDASLPYTLFLLPGMVTLTATFSAIFSAISLIHDRHEGFLQSAIVSPAPSWAVALGKAVGGSVVAFAQCAALLALAPLLTGADVRITPAGLALALLAAMCATFAVTGLGMALAWKVNSVEGFHGVMNLVLMPMWLLSGALFSADTAAGWLATLIRLNPLCYVTRAMRDALARHPADALAWTVTVGFALAGLAAAVIAMARAWRPGGANNPA